MLNEPDSMGAREDLHANDRMGRIADLETFGTSHGGWLIKTK